jgi:DNA-binding transcriptional regulator LsrR (DeoR family)
VQVDATTLHDRQDDMYEACLRYYVQDETMDTIARHLGLSRSTVSRLLSEARQVGMVRIAVDAPSGPISPLARQVGDTFAITVHLATVGDGASVPARLERVCKLAARVLRETVRDGDVIGVGGGVTMSTMVPYLDHLPLTDAVVVQLHGGTNAYDTSARHVTAVLHAVSAAFAARVVPLPVPAFFDHPQTKQAMWRERSVQSVLHLLAGLDLAIFGIGAIQARVPSYVYTGGFLDQA